MKSFALATVVLAVLALGVYVLVGGGTRLAEAATGKTVPVSEVPDTDDELPWLFDSDETANDDPSPDEDPSAVGTVEDPFASALLHVRVVDAAGLPLERIPVEIRCPDHRLREPLLETDPDGRIAFEEVIGAARAAGAEGVWAHLVLPLSEPVHRWIDVRTPPSSEIEITPPPLGWLDVRVIDGDGNPLEPASRLIVRQSLATAAPGSRRIDRRLAQGEGGCRVPVEVGLEIEVVLRNRRIGRKMIPPTKVLVQGPTSEGAVLPVEVRIVSSTPVLVGRIVDAEGAVVSSSSFRALLRAAIGLGRTFDEGVLRTDENGEFRIPVSVTKRYEGAILTIVPEADEGQDRAARVELPESLDAGMRALGDLPLLPHPVLVAGTVVDGKGAPIPEARITIVERSAADEAREAESTLAEVDDDTYLVPGLTAFSDEAGRFTIHGVAPANPLGIRAERKGHVRWEHRRFAPGVEDLVLTIPRFGGISGFIIYSGEIEGPPVEIRTRHETERGAPSETCYFARDGQFLLEGLAPGPHSVELVAGSEEASVLQVTGVDVRPGETTSDSRLQGLDIRRRVITFTVADLDGEPLAAMVTYRWPGDEPGTHRSVWNQYATGMLGIHAPHGAVDVRISAPGHRTRYFRGLSADRDVVLGPPLIACIALGNADELPAQGFELLVEARSTSREYAWSEAVGFDERTRGRVAIPEPGTYEIRFLASASDAGGTTWRAEVESWPTIEILESDVEQFFAVPVPPEVVRMIEQRLESDG